MTIHDRVITLMIELGLPNEGRSARERREHIERAITAAVEQERGLP